MEQCRQCGGGPVQGGWCRTCGMPAPVGSVPAAPRTGTWWRQAPEPPYPAGPGVGPPRGPGGTAVAPAAVTGRAQAMPVLLWAAIGSLALAAVLCFVTFLGRLSTASDLTTAELEVLASPSGTAAPALGLAGAVWLGLCAWFLVLGSRPARAFTLVGAALLTCALVSGLLVVALGSAALLSIAAAAVLVVAPDARAWFDGPYARAVRGPVSLLVARTAVLAGAIAAATGAVICGVLGLIAVAGGLATAAGGSSSELGSAIGGLIGLIGGFVLIAALVLAGLATLGFWVSTALGRANRAARVVATVLAGLGALGALVALGPTTLLGLGVAAVVIGALWVPDDARRHFGDTPLAGLRRWREQLVTITGPPNPTARPDPAAASPASGAVRTSGDSHEPVLTSEWDRPGPHPPPGAATTACAYCGTTTPPGSTFCSDCGTRL